MDNNSLHSHSRSNNLRSQTRLRMYRWVRRKRRHPKRRLLQERYGRLARANHPRTLSSPS